MKFHSLIAVGSLALTANAFWRMECRARAGLARIDPLISPGEVAQHLHSIHGSGGFNENASYDELMASDCTSCAVEEDKSAYWHPSLFFEDTTTGKFEIVEQVGGMLAYYLLFTNTGEKLTAFPKDFRMIAGDSLRRNYSQALGDVSKPDPEKSIWASLGQTSQPDLQQRALGFNCLNYQKDPEGSLYRHFLPDKAYLDANCADGVRFELMFPSCWNGKDTDSLDHRSHVAYPDLVMTGTCPETHPVRIISLFYETIWNTYAFKDRTGRFVVSNGDLQGFGYHGDFMTGWDVSFLQNATDTCTNASGRIQDCPLFTIQDDAKAAQCQIKVPNNLAAEDVSGPNLSSLPGGVAIQVGPGPATATNPPTATSVTSVPVMSYKPGATPTGDQYVPGQVFKQSGEGEAMNAAAAPTETPAAVADDGAPSIKAESEPEAEPASVSVTSSSPTPAPPAITTPPPPPTTREESNNGVRTEYITVGNIVSKIIWVEDVQFVTEYVDQIVTATYTTAPTPLGRRHVRHLEKHNHAQ